MAMLPQSSYLARRSFRLYILRAQDASLILAIKLVKGLGYASFCAPSIMGFVDRILNNAHGT